MVVVVVPSLSTPEDCCVCYGALATSMLHLGNCPYQCPPYQSGDQPALPGFPCCPTRCRLGEEGGHPPEPHGKRQGGASDMQHLSRVDGGDRLRVRILFMQYTPPLRTIGFVEDASPRASTSGARTKPNTRPRARIRPYMRCTKKREEVYLHTVLQQKKHRGPGGWVDTAEETTTALPHTATPRNGSRPQYLQAIDFRANSNNCFPH